MSDPTSDWAQTIESLRHRMAPVGVTTHDCGTLNGFKPRIFGAAYWFMRGLNARLAGRVLLVDHEVEGRTLAANTPLGPADREALLTSDEATPWVRSPLTCAAAPGVCALCYGADPQTLRLASVGEPVGAAAVAALAALTKGPRRKKPGFELGLVGRPEPVCSRGGGVVRYGPLGPGQELGPGRDYYVNDPVRLLVLTDDGNAPAKFCLSIEGGDERYELENETQILVADGETVEPGTPLFQTPPGVIHRYEPHANGFVADVLDGRRREPAFLLAPMNGVVAVSAGLAGAVRLRITGESDGETWSGEVAGPDAAERLRVQDGDRVEAGDELTWGHLDVGQLRAVVGDEAAALRVLFELQRDLEIRRVFVEDRHLELILARLFATDGWAR